MNYQAQVGRSHYEGKAYRSQERWNSYWHQISLVRRANPKTLLEVGVWEGVVARELTATGVAVTTIDIAEDLHPDIVGSITSLPFPDKSFDAVLAAEILEHIQFGDVSQALRELSRVVRHSVIISVPHPGYVFSLIMKFPLLSRISLFAQIPFFWQKHCFNGEHYWELGKYGYSVFHFEKLAEEAGLALVTYEAHADDPGHRFFYFKKSVPGTV